MYASIRKMLLGLLLCSSIKGSSPSPPLSPVPSPTVASASVAEESLMGASQSLLKNSFQWLGKSMGINSDLISKLALGSKNKTYLNNILTFANNIINYIQENQILFVILSVVTGSALLLFLVAMGLRYLRYCLQEFKIAIGTLYRACHQGVVGLRQLIAQIILCPEEGQEAYLSRRRALAKIESGIFLGSIATFLAIYNYISP